MNIRCRKSDHTAGNDAVNLKKKLRALPEKKKLFLHRKKQSVPISINDFAEMTIFLCLISFSVCAKMQGIVDK